MTPFYNTLSCKEESTSCGVAVMNTENILTLGVHVVQRTLCMYECNNMNWAFEFELNMLVNHVSLCK